MNGERDEEEEKETVISFPDAVVYPRAMMVEFLQKRYQIIINVGFAVFLTDNEASLKTL